MSGPKTYGYSLTNDIYQPPVESGRERLRKERKAQQRKDAQRLRQENEIDGLRWHAGELQHSLDKKGIDTTPPVSDDAQVLKQWIKSARAQLDSIKQEEVASRGEDAWASVLKILGGGEGEIEYSANDDIPVITTNKTSTLAKNASENAELNSLKFDVLKKVENFSEEISLQLPEKLTASVKKIACMEDLYMAKMLDKQIDSQLAEFRKKINTGQQEALSLLQKLPSINHPGLEGSKSYVEDIRVQLDQVVEGKIMMNENVRSNVQKIHDRIVHLQAKIASQVVETALEDLGYSVEPITDTLFVEGGKLHFRKGDEPDGYYVRLQVDPRTDKMVFNMVKTEDVAEQTEGKTDYIVENNWCAHQQKVIETLHDRGIDTNRTAHIPAGKAPVEVVSPKTLDQDFWQAVDQSKRKQSIFKELKSKHME